MVRWNVFGSAASVVVAATVLAGCSKAPPPKKEATSSSSSHVKAPPVDYFDKSVPLPPASAKKTEPAKPAPARTPAPDPEPIVESTDHAGDPESARETAATVGKDEINRTARFLGLVAPKPTTWTLVGTSGAMRKAEYSVPGVEGKDAAEIVVFHFGKDDGGTNEANIDRWTKQFRSPDGTPVKALREELSTVDKMKIVLVELSGEYQAMQGGFKPEQLFLGAIVDAPVGKVFIRFVGPRATVEANRNDFMDMLRGLRSVDSSR